MDKRKLLAKVDFGNIDGLYDKHINDYFIDAQYKDALLNGSKYFVLGRKGTRKSALYNWVNRNQSEDGIMVSNKSFSDFPFERLLELSDDAFSKPNQYQSIWKHIIFSELARMIVNDENNVPDDDWMELRDYIQYFFGRNVLDLHKEVTKKVQKYQKSLSYNNTIGMGVGSSNSTEITLANGYGNITGINNRLNTVIHSYLKRHPTIPYYIQFDQLDDNYTVYTERKEFLQCLISLFKSAHQINQDFFSVDVPVKIIVYLRTDIFNQFNRYDTDSAKWSSCILKLNWAIINKDDWNNSNLMKLVNARIKNSLPNLRSPNPFLYFFGDIDMHVYEKENQFHKEDVFKYLIHRTLQRPRDLIQFCIKIKEEVISSGQLNYHTIVNAEKEYSLWLLSEIENEISPLIQGETEALYELLRLFGRKPYSIAVFKSSSVQYCNRIKMSAEDLLKLLYGFGIISNVRIDEGGRITEQFSVIRNDRSVFNRDLHIITHSGFYEGLHTSKFLARR